MNSPTSGLRAIIKGASSGIGKATALAFAKVEAKDWQSVLDINLTSVVHCMTRLLPQMCHRGKDVIINVASTVVEQMIVMPAARTL